MPGLQQNTEVIRDQWGVPHIYAANLDDLFFAQGFVQAQDRLWQMDMWRRYAEGRLAEVLGPKALPHDRLVRRIRYRGPWDEREWTSYHPEGRRIFEAFAAGVNAYIAHATAAGELPVEFRLTGLSPTPWTAETSALRIPARTVGAARRDLQLARTLARDGLEAAQRATPADPALPLHVPLGLDASLIDEAVVKSLDGLLDRMPRVDLVADFANWPSTVATPLSGAVEREPGSNNWTISGPLTASGLPIVANDPHRQVTNPSIRYIVHLNAPGWNVIGATEPPFPGIAIGHNGRIAWGLTIVGTDMADVFVETVNPANANEVRWRDRWEPLQIHQETIPVRGSEPVVMQVKYSRHGPIFHEDAVNHRAYALRSVMHEPGSAEYLGALQLHQIDNSRDFLDRVLRFYKAPSENMICGDIEGNIAWIAAAASPNRVGGWYGRLPVPGTGSYAWDGFRTDLPRELNPARGWIATANHNIQPPDFYPPLFFKGGPPYRRFDRLAERLPELRRHSVEDSRRLVLDSYSSAAAEVLHLFRGWTADTERLEWGRALLAKWDCFYQRDRVEPALYERWRGAVAARALQANTPAAERIRLVQDALRSAMERLAKEQGDDPAGWRWGRIHVSRFPHPLVAAYDLPAAERSGGGGTVAATGATYRQIVDLADLDRSIVTNAPGQSGRPGSPYYGNLLQNWADGEFFPLSFSREAVEKNARHRLQLRPAR